MQIDREKPYFDQTIRLLKQSSRIPSSTSDINPLKMSAGDRLDLLKELKIPVGEDTALNI